MTVGLALGGLLPGLALLYFNLTTNGDPLAFGYERAGGELTGLGFGARGEIRYDQNANPVAHVIQFAVLDGIRNLFDVIWTLFSRLPLSFVLLPTLFLGLTSGYKPRWKTVAAFLILPALHFFYYWHSIRFYLSLFPFLFLAFSFLLAHIWRRQRLAAQYVLAFALFCSLAMLPFGVLPQRRSYLEYLPYFERIERERDTSDKMLIFVPTETGPLFHTLYWYNAIDFYGELLVARDLRERNDELIARYPDHTPFRIDWVPAHARASDFVPLLQPLPGAAHSD